MLATVLADVALVLGAIAAVIAAAAGWMAVQRGRRVEAAVGAMSIKVDSIDHATNQQPKHAPTLPQRLEIVERAQKHHSGQITAIRSEQADGFAAVHERLDSFLTTEALTEQFAAVHERLENFAANAARHHPEDTQS